VGGTATRARPRSWSDHAGARGEARSQGRNRCSQKSNRGVGPARIGSRYEVQMPDRSGADRTVAGRRLDIRLDRLPPLKIRFPDGSVGSSPTGGTTGNPHLCSLMRKVPSPMACTRPFRRVRALRRGWPGSAADGHRCRSTRRWHARLQKRHSRARAAWCRPPSGRGS
jgi:hypothetical protein